MKLRIAGAIAATILCSTLSYAGHLTQTLSTASHALPPTGEKFCEQKAAGLVTCIPTANNTSTDIHVIYVNLGEKTLPPQDVLYLSGSVPEDSVMAIVLDPEDNVVFSGKVENKIGLNCTDDTNDDEKKITCNPWE